MRSHHDQTEQEEERAGGEHGSGRAYARFGLMIATSTVTMYLLTYTNLVDIEHAHVSEERIYMAVLMGSAMTIIMLGFMWGAMYPRTGVNVAIVAGALVVGGTALGLSQSQVLVEDEAYMKGMIPHHSIAILTSERAGLRDVRVEQLAQEIRDAQVREIAEMEWLLDDIDAHGPATTPEEAQQRPVPEFDAEGERTSALARRVLAALPLAPAVPPGR